MKKILLSSLFVALAIGQSGAQSSVADLPLYAGWAFANEGEIAPSDAEKVQLIQDHGYAGFMGCKVDDWNQIKKSVTVPGLYFGARPATETIEQAIKRLDQLAPAISKDKGSIWLFFTYPKDGEKDDEKALEWLRKFSQWSKDSGYRISLYAHSNGRVSFYWPDGPSMLDYLERSGVDNMGLVYTVYHDLRGGLEEKLPENVAAASGKIDFFSVDGPDLIRRQQEGDDLYIRLLRLLNGKGFKANFMIYSRQFKEAAPVYLEKQKQAFEAFLTRALAEQ